MSTPSWNSLKSVVGYLSENCQEKVLSEPRLPAVASPTVFKVEELGMDTIAYPDTDNSAIPHHRSPPKPAPRFDSRLKENGFEQRLDGFLGDLKSSYKLYMLERLRHIPRKLRQQCVDCRRQIKEEEARKENLLKQIESLQREEK